MKGKTAQTAKPSKTTAATAKATIAPATTSATKAATAPTPAQKATRGERLIKFVRAPREDEHATPQEKAIMTAIQTRGTCTEAELVEDLVRANFPTRSTPDSLRLTATRPVMVLDGPADRFWARLAG